jgi:hypothetical protein
MLNLTTNILCNIFVFWTWSRFFPGKSDTLTIVFFVILLFLFTIYYFALFIWTVLLYQKTGSADSKPVLVFFLNSVPIIVIYFLSF